MWFQPQPKLDNCDGIMTLFFCSLKVRPRKGTNAYGEEDARNKESAFTCSEIAVSLIYLCPV
jgi:hypothetical protein